MTHRSWWEHRTMNQFVAERRLCVCYGVLALLLGVTVVFVAVPYNHWRTTLNICPGTYFENTDCGCIFYGVNTFRDFNGGHNSLCMYATMAPIPILLYAIIMALFHMYRVCINNVGRYEDEKSKSMQEMWVLMSVSVLFSIILAKNLNWQIKGPDHEKFNVFSGII